MRAVESKPVAKVTINIIRVPCSYGSKKKHTDRITLSRDRVVQIGFIFISAGATENKLQSKYVIDDITLVYD